VTVNPSRGGEAVVESVIEAVERQPDRPRDLAAT
jgi:hypothetical protein